MKRYWLFEADQYYASGGMLDWIGDYDTVEETENARTVKFDPIETADKIKRSRAGETLSDRVHRELWDRVDKGYHILDTQEKAIVQGWDQYNKEPIGYTPLDKFK